MARHPTTGGEISMRGALTRFVWNPNAPQIERSRSSRRVKAASCSHAQLARSWGSSREAIKRRVACAAGCISLHRGVYAVGHRSSVPRAGVGRRCLRSVTERSSATPARRTRSAFAVAARRLMHVTVRGRAGRKRHAGIRVHRPRALPDDEVTTLRRLPITTPARTFLDLAAAGLRGRALETALDQAEQQQSRSTSPSCARSSRATRARPGTRSLKAQLDRYRGPTDARSRLERLVDELCDDHRSAAAVGEHRH